ncbi:hypothetical protein ASG25_02110 [Rhizobium sp. Leaf384]|uniref:hypothetical protein n=1 Tax=unclassified Rhizobium TaxID=2613769 RepID=UPI000712D9C5|nr:MULTISPECIES: hypothetical protein [unclassified Rhizobium]KQS80427.1 hypothetical protein ASG25_02110 [Rhizobium sp. Leaf384]KQS86476.1 hypothetical protein ASG58_17175 [Rhizobium sp. Leaf383]
MKVIHIQRVPAQPGKAIRALACFDLEFSADVRMFGLKLMAAPDGRRIVYAPSANGGRRLATFSPELSATIADIANSELERAKNSHGSNPRL